MKYNKLLKKGVLSLLLAGSLVFTGMPAWAMDSVDGNTSWEASVTIGTETESSEENANQSFEERQMSTGDQSQTWDTDQQNAFASGDDTDVFSDTDDFQSAGSDDGFSDGEAEEQTSGFGSLDPDDPSPEDENSIEENGLTDEEIEAQLEQIGRASCRERV